MNGHRPRVIVICLALLIAAGCSRSAPADQKPATASTGPAASTATPSASGPIDVCSLATPDDAAKILGRLPSQPPSTTDHAGFGISVCMYIGPALSGAGAQTIFPRLTIQAGRGKDAADILQDDVDKRKATTPLSGVGDSAKRNEAGSFVWATKGGVTCTAEISNGLPPTLTPDTAATGLGGLCQKVLTASNQ